MKLKAEKADGNGYRLNGTKFWITNGAYADTLVVYGKTGEGSRGITTFLIERAWKASRSARRWTSWECAARRLPSWCSTTASSRRECHGRGERRRRVLMSGLDYERTVLAGIQLGIMQACLDVVLPYVRERKQFGEADRQPSS